MKISLISILAFIAVLNVTGFSQPQFPTDPGNAEIVTTDLRNFLEAMEQFGPDSDKKALLQEHYFDRASPGLKEFMQRFGLDAAKLAAAIEKDPDAFNDLRAFAGRISEFDAIYRKKLGRLKAMHPGAMFAPTFLLVGANRGIGQASRVGQLVTVERRSDDLEILATLAIHETVHFQQAMALGPQQYQALYTQKDNMLGWTLREGAAEFVTHKLVNERPEAFGRLNHLKLNETGLWERFKRDLKTQDKTFWLEVSFEDGNKGYPYLLGYAVGYRIVESYYEQAEDKQQAFKDILAISDAADFLKKSGYSPKMTKLQKEFAFGMPAKDAPPELLDYAEMIGISDCVSTNRALDGTWGEPKEMVWKFRYILGGTAVEDSTMREDGLHAGSIRQFNPETKSWYVHFFSNTAKPPAVLSSWAGTRNGNEIRLSSEQKAPNGADGFYKIRFYEISDSGFKWLGTWESKDGSVKFENWKIECRKRGL